MQVFKVLLEGLFAPGAQLSPEQQEAHVELLALAAAVIDGRCAPQAGHLHRTPE